MVLFIISSLFFIHSNLFSQETDIGVNKSSIDTIINRVTANSVGIFLKEISGDVETQIGNTSYRIETRYSGTGSNIKARQYIYDKFSSYGLTASYENYSASGTNVIGKKTGLRYPNQYYVVCCHFDDVPSYPGSTVAPGADDNGSGVAGVLESARILSEYDLDYTVLFIAFDEEEIDILGSEAYAKNASNRGDSILGVINLDMIAYDSNNDGKFEVISDSGSDAFATDYVSAVRSYTRLLIPIKSIVTTGESDQISFWKRQWKAFHIFEDDADRNPNMHTTDDKYGNCNVNYMKDIIKSVIAFIVLKAKE